VLCTVSRGIVLLSFCRAFILSFVHSFVHAGLPFPFDKLPDPETQPVQVFGAVYQSCAPLNARQIEILEARTAKIDGATAKVQGAAVD
jgi:hypothetical protein